MNGVELTVLPSIGAVMESALGTCYAGMGPILVVASLGVQFRYEFMFPNL